MIPLKFWTQIPIRSGEPIVCHHESCPLTNRLSQLRSESRQVRMVLDKIQKNWCGEASLKKRVFLTDQFLETELTRKLTLILAFIIILILAFICTPVPAPIQSHIFLLTLSHRFTHTLVLTIALILELKLTLRLNLFLHSYHTYTRS